jgi:hypothetical protein
MAAHRDPVASAIAPHHDPAVGAMGQHDAGGAAHHDAGDAAHRDVEDRRFDDGRDIRVPRHGGRPQRPLPERGTDAGVAHRNDAAAMVVASAADTEVAYDGVFTPALVAALKAHPELGLDDALRQVTASAVSLAGNSSMRHHPTILQFGQATQPAAEDGHEHTPRKHAVLIANANYLYSGSLAKPIRECNDMQGELAARGYDAKVHEDRTAADMTSLWGAMVGAAAHGDELVAHYSGHGMPEGLAGVAHRRPPGPADVYTKAQVSGAISAATGKGAHIRFVMDSCYSGAAVQTVREERHNEIAAATAGTGSQLRAAAMTKLHEAKAELLAHGERRRTVMRQLDTAITRHQAKVPDPRNAAATQQWDRILRMLHAARPAMMDALDRAVERMWAGYLPMLEVIRKAVHHPDAPPQHIVDLRTLGVQLNYLDDLWNATSKPLETAKAGSAKTASVKVE